MNLTLSIIHHVFLTREERYKLIKGHPVETVGVNSPIWSSNDFTTEPAEEIFCKYTLVNDGTTTIYPSGTVERCQDGYLVTVPSKAKAFRRPNNETWRKMLPEEREQWYESHNSPPNFKKLLDIKDGGAEYLRFQFHKTMRYKEHEVNVFHYIEIKDIGILNDSIV